MMQKDIMEGQRAVHEQCRAPGGAPAALCLKEYLDDLTGSPGAGLASGRTPSRMLSRRILIELTSTLVLCPIVTFHLGVQ